jgi:hypothetical protein
MLFPKKEALPLKQQCLQIQEQYLHTKTGKKPLCSRSRLNMVLLPFFCVPSNRRNRSGKAAAVPQPF